MTIRLINEALLLLHDVHGTKADQVVTILRKVRTNFINEAGTVAAAIKPAVEVAREVVDAVADETINVLNIVDEAANPADSAEKEPEPLAKIIAEKGKRRPGRPRIKT